MLDKLPHNWFYWALVAAVLTSIWNVLLMITPENITKQPEVKFVYIRLILITTGILSFISLFIPGFSPTLKDINKIIENINLPTFMFQCLILLFYQAALLFAYSFGGPAAAVIVNTNVVIVKIFYNQLVGKSTPIINWVLLFGWLIYSISLTILDKGIPKNFHLPTS
tara:strand:+ start:60 stop:560 length:501 start_codon:yes stop_codon:yes gene_type:complete